jgi:hypothetical protein
MDEQPPLPFDGEQLKALGMHMAANAVPTWLDQAHAAVRYLAATGCWFTSEDVTQIVGLPRGDVGQHRNNAVGAVMSAEARAGTIVRVGYEKSKRPVSHAAVLSRWVGAGQQVKGGVA